MRARQIDRENPWPWLEPFDEAAAAFFNGRDDDSLALERYLLSGPASVLFGKSGLGKTSLLQAGLFPRLRRQRLLPVLVRLDHGDEAPAALAQIHHRLREEGASHGLTPPGPLSPPDPPGGAAATDEPAAALWLALHTPPLGARDAAGQSWQPVFVLDQFEEIFTLGAQNAERQRRQFGDLGDLIENRIPAAVGQAIAADEELLDRLQLDAQPYRVILGLREDYLPELERWCDRIPRLGPNRYRLLPMRVDQALAATRQTGGALLSDEAAERIVRFVASQQESDARGAVGGADSAAPRIEPALLSLVCAGLNAARQASGAAQIDADNLEQHGGAIIESFYDDALTGIAPELIAFVENELITPEGIRLTYPLKSIVQRPGIVRGDVDTLIDRRLLRKDAFVDGDRVEMVHDRLAAVALQRRRHREQAAAEQRLREDAERAAALLDEQRKRTAAEAAARRQAEEAGTRLRRLQRWLWGALIGLVVLLGVALAAAWHADRQSGIAEQRLFEATTLRLAAEGPAITRGDRVGGSLRGLLTLLAAHRLGSPDNPRSSAAAYGALQREEQRFAGLRLLLEQSSVVTSVAFSPDGRRIVSGSDDNTLRLWDAATGAAIGEPLRGHTERVASVAFSPDGRRIVSGSGDKTLRLWDAATGAAIGEPLQGHTEWVSSVAFSPDGRRIVSGS
ncbi:MAG: hypothetical protein RKP46_08240, partial [Candidatus Accumulibacter sp.]|uniref:WD40 repeat domain-containing protein n=1 Tax=Accumulibacter sp. TaxID=2053492 RepID=UPI00287A99F8|nr:hypothetical protein [Accumulibacter sp.]